MCAKSQAPTLPGGYLSTDFPQGSQGAQCKQGEAKANPRRDIPSLAAEVAPQFCGTVPPLSKPDSAWMTDPACPMGT